MRSQDAQLVAAKYTSSCPVGAAVLLGKAVNRLILKQVVYDRNFFTLGILLSFCHLILTVVSLVVSFALGAPRFDQPDLPVSAVEEVGTFIFSIFSQPMMFIVDTFHLSPNGTILEWSLFFLNSSLWGFCLTLLFSLLRSLLFSHA
jgi:hypothetical protein